MAFAETYELAPDNTGIREWARYVQGTLIGLGIAGWFGAWLGVPDWALTLSMCWVTLVIEVWGFHAYRQCSLAFAREGVGAQCAYWIVVVIGCAAWTVFSIYHALPIISGQHAAAMGAAAMPAYLAFAFLALTIPFHEWAIDRVERAPLKRVPEMTPVGGTGGARAGTQLGATLAESEQSGGHPNRRQQRRPGKGRQRTSGRPHLSLIQNAALAAMIAQMGWMPRDLEAFERAVGIAQEQPGISQEELAHRAGTTRSTLQRWIERAPDGMFPRAAA